MKTNSSLILLLLLASATAATITADSYVNLPPQGYAFSFTNSQGPVQLTIMGLPDGLTVKDYTIAPVGPVQPGQYILSVKASDNAGKDEKILIMNVDPNFTTPTTQPVPTPATTASSTSQTASSSSTTTKIKTTSTSTTSAPLDISSMNALFQTGPTLPVDTSSSSVDSLQSYFNNIDTSSSSSSQGTPISNSLSQILTDFSNSNNISYTPTTVPSSVSAQTLVTQNSISLNFSNSQRNTVST